VALGPEDERALYNEPMNESFDVTVAKDLEDLIPTFMKNRHKEVETLRVALASQDFEQLRQLGHRMKGVGNSYGFEQISLFGKQVEDGARTGDRTSLAACIADYHDYLARVRVVYE
jgi:HPt (histidine-containing phosphotransfer) domain-containing protein